MIVSRTRRCTLLMVLVGLGSSPVFAGDPADAELAEEAPEPAPPKPPSDQLVIYPGFAKADLKDSVRATLNAALGCVERGDAVVLDPQRARAPYLSARWIDGVPLRVLERRAEVQARAVTAV
jgi:hypothetical protein